jgi:hypothetical protein
MKRHLFPGSTAVAVLILLLTTGCGTISRITKPVRNASAAAFTGASTSDLKFEGVKSGPAVVIQAIPVGNLDERTRTSLEELLGAKPVGVLLPITRVGETKPWWVFCPAGEMEQTCTSIPSNARVAFSGQPLGVGGVWVPTRLTWSEN